MPAAFISYSREDSEFALRLAQDLKAAGANIWLDQLDLRPGSSWDNSIEDALLAAPQMLVILSPVSVKSENVRDEISYAIRLGKTVIPVLYMECVIPLRLERKQHIDFRSDYTRGLAALLDQLRVTNPDQTVLDQAAEDEAQRHATWQAREAQAQRLKELKDRQIQEEEQHKAAELEQLRQLNRKEATEKEARELEQVRLAEAGREPLATVANETPQNPPQSAQGTLHEPQSGHDLRAPVTSTNGSTETPVSTGRKGFSRSVKITIGVIVLSILILGGAVAGVVAYNRAHTPQRLYDRAGQLLKAKNYTDAVPLLQESCDKGIVHACEDLGDRYLIGEGVSTDPSKAFTLYQKACLGGDKSGCTRTADMYTKGVGVPKNLNTAEDIYRNSGCAGGCLELVELADDFFFGTDVPRDRAKAVDLFKMACDDNVLEGCGRMGMLEAAYAKDKKDALPYLNKGCNEYDNTNSDPTSCAYLDYLNNVTGPLQIDPGKIATIYRSTCAGGNSGRWACGLLGNLYLTGTGVSKDQQEAVAMWQEGCNAGDAASCVDLGNAYHVANHYGTLPDDPVKAKQYYEQACNLGAQYACDYVKSNVSN